MDTIWIDLIKYRSLNSVDLSLPFNENKIFQNIKNIEKSTKYDSLHERRCANVISTTSELSKTVLDTYKALLILENGSSEEDH